MPIAVIRSLPPESGAIIEVSGDPNCFMPYSTMRSRSRAKVGDIVKVEAVPNRRGDGVVYSEREYYERNTPIGDEVDGIVRHVTGDRNAAFVDIGVLNDGRLGASDVITHSSREKLAVKVGDLLRLRVSGVREDARGRRRFSLCSPEVYERDEFLEQNRAEWSERLAHWKNVLGVRQATIEHEHSLLSRFKYSEHIIGSNSVKLSVPPRHRQALDHQVGQDISFHIVRSDGTYLDALSGIEDIEFDPESNLLEVNVGRRNWTIQDRDLEKGELQECRHDPNVERQRIALDNFEKLSIANPKLGGTFINIEGAVLKQHLPCATYFDKNVGTNANQRDIVERALASDPLFLIQGPPGTGKTTVITEIILQETKRNPDSLILLSSQSNIAVDNVLGKLVDSPLGNSFLRYGQADRVQDFGWTLEGRIAESYEAHKNSNIALLTEERKECENHLRTLETQLQAHQERLRSLQELKASRPWEAVQERLEETYRRWEKSGEVEKGRRKEVEQHEIDLRNEKDGSLSLRKKQTLLQNELDRIRRIDPSEPIHNVLAAKEKLDLSICEFETAKERVQDQSDRINTIEDELISTKQQLYHLSRRWWRRHFSRDRIAELTESSLKVETKLSSGIGKHRDLFQTMHNCEEAAKAAHTNHEKWRANCLAMMRELQIREGGLNEEEFLRGLQERLTPEYAGGLERRLTSLRQNQVTDIQSEIDQTKSSIRKAEENVASHQKTLLQLRDLHEETLLVKSEDRKAFVLTCRESLKDDEPGWIEYRKAAQLSFEDLYNHLVNEERFTNFTFTSKLDRPVKETRAGIDSHGKSIQIARSRIQEIDRETTRFENNEDKADKFQEYEKSIIESCRVIGATCSHAASGRVVGFLEARGRNAYDLVIIDEAAKATEPEVLVPLQRAKRVILVGDEKQLPPYLDDEDFDIVKIQEHSREFIGALVERDPDELKDILSTSLFQSLVKQAATRNEDILRLLTTQYRMHESIGTMVSEVFYEGTLENGPQDRNHGIGTLESPAIWYSTNDGSDSRERRPGGGQGFYNPCEVEIIKDLMRDLEAYYRQNPADEVVEVGIITGYRAQVSNLSLALTPGNRNRWKATNVEIATVDAFQGKDKDIILFSVVRSNDRGNVGFLKDPRRLNVALSRAKNLLIIVGNVATVEVSGKQGRSYLNDVYQHVRQNEGWRIVKRLSLFAS